MAHASGKVFPKRAREGLFQFSDEIGPEKVLYFHDPKTKMKGILIMRGCKMRARIPINIFIDVEDMSKLKKSGLS
jgi:hypothetical protein